MDTMWEFKPKPGDDRPYNPDLTEDGARAGIIHYAVELLKHLPEGIDLRAMRPEHMHPEGIAFGEGPSRGGIWNGAGGSYAFWVGYNICGYDHEDRAEADRLFEKAATLFHEWEWLSLLHNDKNGHGRVAMASNPEGYHFALNQNDFGGLSIQFTSPGYPPIGEGRAPMPFIITREGPSGYEPPVRKKRVQMPQWLREKREREATERAQQPE